MKKNSIYALMSAIALAGVIGFSSCSSTEDDNAPVNPGYDPETGTVPVEFLFNVSTSSNSSATRMSEKATQAAGNYFRGISDTRLFSFVQAGNPDYQLLDPTLDVGRRYDLSELVTNGQITTANSRRVIEMAFPLNTNTLALYGKATLDNAETNYSSSESYGSLDSNFDEITTLENLTFTIKRRLDESNLETYRKVEKLLAGVLSCIMNTNCSRVPESGISATAHPNDVASIPDYKYAVAKNSIWGEGEGAKQISWRSYANAEKKSPYTPTHSLYPLEDKLSNLYIQMTTIQGEGGELRASSGEDLIRTINDLWSVVNEVRCATPLNEEETVAKFLAAEIHSNISEFFSASTVPTEPGPVSGVDFKSVSTVATNFMSNVFWPGGNELRNSYGIDNNLSLPEGKLLSTFPGCYNIPKGATHVKFNNETLLYDYPATFNTSGVGNVAFTVEDYLYCPELVYFGNSPIRVSDKEYKPNDYPQGVSNWDEESSWDAGYWSGDYVKSSTRSVAMKYDINYGTALLETKVKYGAAVLRDNNHAIQKSFHPEEIGDEKTEGEYNQEPDKKITIDESSFELVGVVVGGQSRNVGWDFLPKKVGTTPDFEYGFIYDSAIPSSAKQIPAYGSVSEPNYTLLFDNYDATKAVDAQNSVYVALEFKNNSGQDFFGNYNLIRDGGHFYLIGLLNPNSGTFAWPTGSSHILPPYNNDGTSTQIKRVFMQDYVTKVNFVIGENSLKSAYLTSPDLRSTSLRLGLSVDIEWSDGIDFGEVVMGGNDY